MTQVSLRLQEAKTSGGTAEQPSVWYTLDMDEVLKRLDTSAAGLSRQEALARLERYGDNTLPTKKAPSLVKIFITQFMSPLIYILIAAGAVSLVIGEYADAGFIFAVILLNAGLGTYQEFKAEKSAEALQQMLKIKAHVRRAGQDRQVDAECLVPGDIVLLESGNKVPADVRLIELNNLAIDEALLTGESQAVQKNLKPLQQTMLPASEQHNMAFAGTTVTSGRAVGVVTATGSATEVGQIAESVTERSAAKTPLVMRMEDFSRKIAFIFVGVSILMAAIAWGRGYPLHEVFLTAVALAVAAIPEGLPVAMTVALSIGSQRMAKRNVIVRKLTAVEGLGSCTYIASDKTGTLTLNKQTVKLLALPDGSLFQVSGEGYNGEGKIFRQPDEQSEETEPLTEQDEALLDRLARISTIGNEGTLYREEDGDWVHDGDPVDVALLGMAYKLGENPQEIRHKIDRLGKIPYESERQFSAQFFRYQDEVRVAVKGAAEKLLPHCARMLTRDGEAELDVPRVENLSTHLADRGYRVLAIADGLPGEGADLENPDEDDLPPLTLLALVGMIDPLRPEARPAIQTCRRAGVKVTMVTGDHPATALAIARQLEIAQNREEVTTGQEIHQLGEPHEAGFQERMERTSVFARVAPLQKLHIVEALKHRGHFVAVTGDGVNDTPALRAAHIGVAMGSGSDVAKDTATIIVADDNFASIEAGVEEGRYAYDNVRKVIFLLLSTGIGEIFVVMAALLANLALPLHAVQLLWLNIVTNGIQDVALAFEAGEQGALERPPRNPEEGIFNRLMIEENLVAGLTIGLVSFGTWYWLSANNYGEAQARNLLLLLLVLLINIHALNSRSELQSAFKIPPSNNWLLIIGILVAQGLHILAMHVSFMQELLGIMPISMGEWISMLLLASILLLVMEVFKWLKRRQGQQAENTGGRMNRAAA